MGFYGKVEHTDRIQFTIDKVYQSRYDMEQSLVKNEDSVFIGRYVLVDYDTTGKNYLRLFKENNNNYLNFSINLDKSTRAIFEGNTDFSVTSDQIVYTLDEQLRQKFFRCNGSKTEEGIKYATFIEIETPAEENPNSYYQNYQKDLIYGESRGYDSTVWQKIYVDEKEEYVMIAELNSVVPTFNIVSDAPTVEPVAPHFDSDSTNVYYRLHLQPQWGMRIKKANGADSSDSTKVKSDEKVKYDGKTSYDGAIYYNKAGFEKETRSKDTTTDNKVSILPTGISHASYNKHDSNNPSAVSEQIDIQEISILLPALGNAISDVWDMVYGENRNLDIYWDSPHGLRLTRDDVGFAYKTNEIQTLAGCINTAHDLLGMIIRADTTEVGNASIDNIYYGDLENKGATAYYLKEPYMKFTKLTNADALKLMADKPTKVDPPLVEFSEGSYHIATTWGFSHDKTKVYKKGTQYYKINATNIELDDTYAANKYYYQPKENLNYLLDQNSTPTRTNDYYSITFNAKTSVAADAIKTYFYKPEAHVDNEDGSYTGLFYLDENDVLYKIDGTDDPGFQDVIGYYDSNDETKWVGYFIGENYTSKIENDETTGQPVRVYSFKKKTPVQMIEFTYSASNKTGNYYYKDNNNYICLTNINQVDTKISYGLLTLTKKNKFYEPDIYYYIGGDDYIKGNSTDMIEGVQYVILSGHTEPLKTAFYEPSEYYYLDTLGNYVLDNNPTMTKNRDYYIKKFVYVYNDSEGILTQGAKWNINITEIPSNIELASGEIDYRWKELVGFSKDLNTINGLIVRINSLIKFDDYTTRDQKTVQGCINRMNDIINTFDTLKPQELVIVDDHGRITCASTSGDDWINVAIDSKIDSKKIEIIHADPKAPEQITSLSNQTPNFGEEITVTSFNFDEKGHKNATLSYNIQIPKGSLKDEEFSGSDIITQLNFVDNTGALSTERKNLSSLKLSGYIQEVNSADITAEDTLGEALSKLQTQIIEEEKVLNEVEDVARAARNNANRALDKINNLDAVLSTETTSEIITSITQEDGKLTSINTSDIGNLTLTGLITGDQNINSEEIKDTNTINEALSQLQNQILILKNNNPTNNTNITPTLTENEKSALIALADDYLQFDKDKLVAYSGGSTRNTYSDQLNTSDSRLTYDSNGKFKTNCGLFAQLLWGGVSVSSFKDKAQTYSGVIEPAFDWGYYFKFILQKFYNWRKLDADGNPTEVPFGYIEPSNGAKPYSPLTYWDDDASVPGGQRALTFMRAADMARELKMLGCEIKMSELDVGDLVFLRAPRLDDNETADEIEKASYLNIDHVLMVYKKGDPWGNGFEFVECSTYGGSNNVIIVVGPDYGSTQANYNLNQVRAISIYDRAVMAARHPIAFFRQEGNISPLPEVDGVKMFTYLDRVKPFGEI